MQQSLLLAERNIGFYVNSNKTKFICFKLEGDISTLNVKPLNLVDQFTYLGSNISSTESDVNVHMSRALTTIDKLSIIWKSDVSGKIKRDFFQTMSESLLLYSCTTGTLTKRMEKKT